MFYVVLKSNFPNTNFNNSPNTIIRNWGTAYTNAEFTDVCNGSGFNKSDYYVRFIKDNE